MTTTPMTPTTTARPVTTGSTIDHFESIYVEAGDDEQNLPWHRRGPSPALINWLNVAAPRLIRCGARVAVVGCGLGADAREARRRGYEVVAFDCSPTAVRWAQRLDPSHAEGYHQADLFDPPPRWVHRFDLVIEINTIQALQPDRRQEAMVALSRLMAPHGHMLMICRGADRSAVIADGPPWPLTEAELREVIAGAGLVDESLCSFEDDEDPPVRRMRGVFHRG